MRIGTNEDVAVTTGGNVQDMVRLVKYFGARDARFNQEIKIRIVVATSSLARKRPPGEIRPYLWKSE